MQDIVQELRSIQTLLDCLMEKRLQLPSGRRAQLELIKRGLHVRIERPRWALLLQLCGRRCAEALFRRLGGCLRRV